ncbi:MAG: hypothetical protein LZF86_70030 [Nitrospira sp.]|nr:MAG: hypothetical protein LZF86_70030 [Nitrospira sp.]
MKLRRETSRSLLTEAKNLDRASSESFTVNSLGGPTCTTGQRLQTLRISREKEQGIDAYAKGLLYRKKLGETPTPDFFLRCPTPPRE